MRLKVEDSSCPAHWNRFRGHGQRAGSCSPGTPGRWDFHGFSLRRFV